jgi:hypothetical protein
MLDKYIFPSMVNLVVFLEYASSIELRAKFEKDIQSLFFGVSKKTNANVFYRFIRAVLSMDKQGTGLPDFIFVLFDILQREIWEMIRDVTPYKYNDDTLFHNVILPDMGKASLNAWSYRLYCNRSFKKNRGVVGY